MKKISLVNHSKGAIGLRFFGLGPNLMPSKGLLKLKQFLNKNAFWAQGRTINDLKKCLGNSDVVISIWFDNEIVGFGRALSDGVFRGVLWDIVIDKDHQGKGYGKLIVSNLLNAKMLKNTRKILVFALLHQNIAKATGITRFFAI